MSSGLGPLNMRAEPQLRDMGVLAAFTSFPESSKMPPLSSHGPRVPAHGLRISPKLRFPPVHAVTAEKEATNKAANTNAPGWICW